MSDYKLFWGDTHTNLHLKGTQEDSALLAAALKHAQAVLDFWPIAYYPYHYEFHGFYREECWRSEEAVDAAWRATCELAAKENRSREFVVFPGFEWQGDARHGDHNVFFLEDYPPILRSRTLPELYADIHRLGRKALAIPHHTAYQVGQRGRDWSVHDEQLSPWAEIYSTHGCSESDEEWIGLRRNWHMGPGVSGGTVEDGLDRGLKLGIVASTDEHAGNPGAYGLGLMGCYARELTRESLWEAFTARRVYGVTGDRIELDFAVEGAPMGAAVARAGSVRALARVRGSDAVDRIELLRNNRVIATHCHNGTWGTPRGRERIRAKLRVEVGWGPMDEEIPGTPARKWTCRIEVPDGAILAVEPCWRRRGQWLGDVAGGRCEFGFITPPQALPHDTAPTETDIFEVEARPGDLIKLDLDGKGVSFTLAEAMQSSRVVSFLDETAEAVRRRCGVDPADLMRDEWLYFCGHKVKIHRAIPQAGFTAEMDYTDDDPPAGVNHYRVRVIQRNGQAAWSSPVWVENG